MSTRKLLSSTAARAAEFYDALDTRHVAAEATYAELSDRLRRELPVDSSSADEVIDELIRHVEGGLLASGSPRFYGWVMGGTVPAALAADWLSTAWDQNGAIYQTSPAAAVIEEVAGEWLKELLGLPRAASFAMVTGCQMAHLTGIAAARHRLLADRGIDVERQGLAKAPPFRVLTGGHRHESVLRAVRFAGIGTDAVEHLPLDERGRLSVDAVTARLEEGPEPTIIILQAGDINTGAFDPFDEICEVAHRHGAWVHVDGAFGLWAAVSDTYRHLLEGVENCDSWATDGHKWLNLPFDHGFAFVRDAEAHHAAMSMTASYFIAADGAGRDPMNWNPDWSRRPRGLATYAAIRSLGRSGIAEIVERCCRLAERLISELGALPGTEVLAPAVINQGLVRFLAEDGEHDRRTDEVVAEIQAEGTAWFGPTTWNGKRAMRVSLCNFRTTDRDIDLTVEAVERVLERFGSDRLAVAAADPHSER